MEDLTPSRIVKELDSYIIGQQEAKKCVAIALRNRYRRKLLSDEMKEEVTPKNIIMMGPTGVGKTEIARRLAKLVDAPFIKVEVTKFTEVGYVGKDVESMIRDLVNTAIRMVRQRDMEKVAPQVNEAVTERLLDCLAPLAGDGQPTPYEMFFRTGSAEAPAVPENRRTEMREKREKARADLLAGRLEGETIEIEVEDSQSINIGSMGEGGGDEITMNVSSMLGSFLPKRKKRRNATVAAARQIFSNEEAQRLIDPDAIAEEGLRAAEQEGIIFLDEIDKIASSGYKGGGPDVSREGVQRDILPIVEGCTVNTKYGPIKTDYILFIGAGAFHASKVSDLIPELQGRFPIKVKLDSLSEEDFRKILTQPQNAIIKQYTQLLDTEGVALIFEEKALLKLAGIAYMENETSENIGARRLFTVMEKLLAEISFHAPEYSEREFSITEAYVESVFRNERESFVADTAKYIV
ncbi:MAG: ATP-dependent protease ATPase subunit HslU [Eubacteriaceae bacterium]|jgi:ATP-dependent HslUV protease ATP-binding subunit HslU|nr:ATP-dependent protease ATPase subunit HslU [Eubacteriaceae bacterium]